MRHITLSWLATVVLTSLPACATMPAGGQVGSQLNDPAARLISHDQGPPMGDAQVPGAVTQTSESLRGFRSIQQQCPPGAQDTMGGTLVPQAEIGIERPPPGEGGTAGFYARSGCQAL